MNRRYLLGGLLVVVVVSALSVGLTGGVGSSLEPEADDAPSTETEPSETTDETPPFEFHIESIDKCGQTCRDVTATVDNTQDESASDVTVTTRIFAGENNTDTDALVWEDTESVGTLDEEASYTMTKRVDLSLQAASRIDQQDGWITIQTTIDSETETVTTHETKQVG